MAQACNSSTLGGRGGWITRSRDQDHPGQNGETPSLLKIQKISWMWWCAPVVPAIQEAEVRGSPEPREAEAAVSLDCAPALQPGGQSETLSQKQTKNQTQQVSTKLPKS